MAADLKAIDAEPLGEGIKSLLRRAAEMAEAGELSSVAVAYVLRDGSVGSMNSTPPSRPLLSGAVAYLQHHLIAGSK